MARRRTLAVTALALVAAAVAAAGWAFLRPPAVAALDPADFRAAEVRLEPWGEDTAPPPARTADPEVVAALVAVLRSGTEVSDHKCGSRGAITLRRADGSSVKLAFLPGHHPNYYELRYDGRVYRVPRDAFVTAMRRVGVDVPPEC